MQERWRECTLSYSLREQLKTYILIVCEFLYAGNRFTHSEREKTRDVLGWMLPNARCSLRGWHCNQFHLVGKDAQSGPHAHAFTTHQLSHSMRKLQAQKLQHPASAMYPELKGKSTRERTCMCAASSIFIGAEQQHPIFQPPPPS